ncbi:MAG TPA: heme-binding domain-containing protein [Cyclobacteriaceae bacterium]
MLKKIGLTLIAVLIIIQFIRPDRNTDDGPHPADISNVYALPDGVHDVLRRKCYDCHSNNTTYPWYVNIQPVGWWMSWHVSEGKSELNFSTFGEYAKDRADHKLEEIIEVLEEGAMPLKSYLWMHSDAAITREESEVIAAWIKSLGVVHP